MIFLLRGAAGAGILVGFTAAFCGVATTGIGAAGVSAGVAASPKQKVPADSMVDDTAASARERVLERAPHQYAMMRPEPM